MVSSKDHKRAFDNDEGLNTGGMGTISPNPYYTDEIAKECMDTIFIPTIEAMNKEGRPFKGCLYFGLMITPNGQRLLNTMPVSAILRLRLFFQDLKLTL